jgi:hypothetical protein
MTPRKKKLAAALATAVLALSVALPMALGSGPTLPTILNPATGTPFPQVSVATGATCPVAQQCNATGTTSGTVTIKLPTSAADGQILAVVDADGNAATHAITVQGNGHTIDGASSATIATNGGGLVSEYSSTAGEWVSVLFQRQIDGNKGTLSIDLRPQSVSGSVTLGGDVTGPSNANTAIKINGTTVPAGGALTTGTVLRATGVSAAAWGALDLSNTGATTGLLPVARGVLPSVAMSALAVDWSTSYVFSKTLGAGANTITFSNQIDGQTVVVILTGAASTVTWPSVKWSGGTAPTQTASGVDAYTFVDRGGTIYGSVVQDLK